MNKRFVAKCFTLIELMIVIILISIITATVAPRLADQIQGARVRKAARDFSNMCRLARSHAAKEVKTFKVVIDQSKKQMSIKDADGKAVKGMVFVRKLPAGITASAVGESGSVGGGQSEMSVEFNPDGTSSGAHALFKDTTGRKIKIRVEDITGLPVVED